MKDFLNLERIFKPLANRRRLAALSIIKHRGEVSVGEIAEELKLSIQATSRHLQILARADIIDSEQKSSLVFYRLSKSLHSTIKVLIDSL